MSGDIARASLALVTFGLSAALAAGLSADDVRRGIRVGKKHMKALRRGERRLTVNELERLSDLLEHSPAKLAEQALSEPMAVTMADRPG